MELRTCTKTCMKWWWESVRTNCLKVALLRLVLKCLGSLASLGLHPGRPVRL
ncbi:hypothetical protein HanXRQr2_Chr04g0174441 [Helianthus annuus]|uniref:Uncharacterized protein n=1 Tax=Helianthus annuus TaxID=4232 RepID=A0A9K3NT06_HELAN|nr:hypothetical protein HanXRQr2_Chr04g0174441 [Helianthus annuus]KAJ0931964.1 hypothetical protein HanPSC8_Chr04g0168081 [Helianthus annuus]